jgi:hypothetical protein
VVSFTPGPLYPQGKSPRYSLDRRLGEPQSRCERRGEEKILDPTRTRTPTPRSSSPQPVAIPTALSREAICSSKKSGFFQTTRRYTTEYCTFPDVIRKVKVNPIPVTGREGPQCSETSKIPHFLDNRLTNGGKIVSLTRRPPFTPRNIPGTHFC